MSRVDPASAMTAKDPARRFRLASPAAALVLGAVVLLLAAAGLPLGDIAHQLAASDASEVILTLLFAAVGVVVAWHQPRYPIAGSCWAPPGSSC